MSQISKRNRNAAKLAFAGVGMITLPLFTLTDASADAVNGSTVIYGNSNAGGSTKITNNADVPDAGAVTTLNSSIRNLQAESNGIIHISPVPTTITKADLAATQAKVNQLVQLVQTYNQNKAQLNAQDNTMESFTGKKAVDTYTKIDGSNLDNALSQMQSINSQMSGMINDNQNTVNKTAQDSATRTTLDDAVKSANQQITNASGSIKEAQDGIYGNMDDVKRKSYDSSQQDGVKVDNNQTQQVNTVKTNVQPVQYTKVSSVSDINNALNNILNNVKNQTVDINNQTKTAGDYKDNALHNIDDVNQWLQNERRVGEQAKSTIDNKYQTAVGNLNTSIDNGIQKLKDIYATLDKGTKNGSKLPAETMKKVQKRIDDAVAILQKSKIDTNQLPDITMANPVDFGNIGAKPDDQNGSTDGSINNTKTTEDAKFQAAINDVIQKQADSINKALGDATNVTQGNQTQIDKFIDTMSKGGVFPQEELNKMQIYTKNPKYKKYLDKVMHMDSDSPWIDLLRNKIGRKSIATVPKGTSFAETAAAIYLNNQQDYGGKGFGSVMFKSDNINKLGVGIDADDVVANSQNFVRKANGAKGTEGIYEYLTKDTYGNGTPELNRLFTGNAAVRNLQTTFLNADQGNERTLTVVSFSPTISLTIPKSFVSMDANGKIVRKDVKFTMTVKSYNGQPLNPLLQAHNPTRSGTKGLFIYAFQISNTTGTLTAQSGYIPVQGTALGGGGGVNVSAGAGEEASLGSDTNVNGSLTIQNSPKASLSINNNHSSAMFNDITDQGHWGQPVDNKGYRGDNAPGISQNVRVQVLDGDDYSANAPLYVSDIDDGQQMLAYTGTGKDETRVVTGDGNADTHSKASDWTNPYGESGRVIAFDASQGSNEWSTEIETTNMDKFTAALYKNHKGLNDMRVTLRSKTQGVENYENVSTAFFAPFGIMPMVPDPPEIKVNPITASVSTANVVRPTAVAHTEGNYTINAQPMYIQSDTHVDGDVKNMSAYLDLPTYNGVKPTTMITASNDSFVVRQNKPTTRVTGAGNSLVIRYTNTPRLTASGNSLVIRNAQRNGLTASGNSLVVTGYSTGYSTPKGTTPVVTSLSGTGLVSVDANGKLVMNSLNNAMSINPVANKIVNNSPVVTANADGTHTVSMAVYVDPAMQSVAQQALNDWKTALASKGVTLNANLTTNINNLKSGVALAILNSNNSDVRADSQSGQDNLDQIGGLTTKRVYANLNADNGQAIFNADGTVTAGDALQNAGTVIQLNNEGINQYESSLFRNNMNVGVLKHEIGHSFGLQHVQGDSLMTPKVGNSTFTGQISDEDATLAARNLVNPAYMNTAQTSITNKKFNLGQD